MSVKPGPPHTFTREFKLAAVKKIVVHGLSYAEVARELSVTDGQLRAWRKKLVAEGALPTETQGNPSIETEVKRLREENRQLQIEREILEKATAFFARESR